MKILTKAEILKIFNLERKRFGLTPLKDLGGVVKLNQEDLKDAIVRLASCAKVVMEEIKSNSISFETICELIDGELSDITVK